MSSMITCKCFAAVEWLPRKAWTCASIKLVALILPANAKAIMKAKGISSGADEAVKRMAIAATNCSTFSLVPRTVSGAFSPCWWFVWLRPSALRNAMHNVGRKGKDWGKRKTEAAACHSTNQPAFYGDRHIYTLLLSLQRCTTNACHAANNTSHRKLG